MEVKYSLKAVPIGSKVVEIGLDEREYPYIVVVKGKKEYAIFVSRDEECNGPGQPIIQIQDI